MTREKIPVFPFEWLLIENIINLDKIKLNIASKKELVCYYEQWLSIEKFNRQKIEKLLLSLTKAIG